MTKIKGNIDKSITVFSYKKEWVFIVNSLNAIKIQPKRKVSYYLVIS
jgi:hypothetical protein